MKKIHIQIVIIIFILLLLALVFVLKNDIFTFVFHNNNILTISTTTEPYQGQSTSSSLEQAIKEPLVSDEKYAVDFSQEAVSSWKACENKELGYEFKYPGEWYIYRITAGGEEANISEVHFCEGESLTFSKNETVRNGFIPPSITVMVLSKDWDGSLEEYLQSRNTERYPVVVEKERMIDGVNTIQYSYKKSTQVVTLHKRRIILIRVQMLGGDLQNKFLDTILSTFKFID